MKHFRAIKDYKKDSCSEENYLFFYHKHKHNIPCSRRHFFIEFYFKQLMKLMGKLKNLNSSRSLLLHWHHRRIQK